MATWIKFLAFFLSMQTVNIYCNITIISMSYRLRKKDLMNQNQRWKRIDLCQQNNTWKINIFKTKISKNQRENYCRLNISFPLSEIKHKKSTVNM